MKGKKVLFIGLLAAGIIITASVLAKRAYDAKKEREALSAQMHEYFKETVPKVAVHALRIAVRAYNDKGIQYDILRARALGTYDQSYQRPYPNSHEVMGVDADVALGRRITNCESALRNGLYKLSEEYERFASPDEGHYDQCAGYSAGKDSFAKIIRDIALVPKVTKADNYGRQRTEYAEHCNEVCRAAAKRLGKIAESLAYSYLPIVRAGEYTFGMVHFLNWAENADVPIETVRERFAETKAVLQDFLASKKIKEDEDD